MHNLQTEAAHLGKVMSRITAAADLVWRTREKIGDRWPLPDQADCLAFAVTETSEVIRARLTATGKYSLNNPRDEDERAEWADTAMMLLSFLGEHYDFGLMQRRLAVGAPRRMLGMDDNRRIMPQPASALASLVGMAYYLADRAEDTADMPYMLVEEVLALIAAAMPDLHQVVGARLERIARRVEGQGAPQRVRLADLCIGSWFAIGGTRYCAVERQGQRIKVFSDVGDGGYSWFDADTLIQPGQVLGPQGGD